MEYESKSARRDRRRREQEEKFYEDQRWENIRRANNPTLEERIEDIEEVLRQRFNVKLNGRS